jgi:hypothetical protein
MKPLKSVLPTLVIILILAFVIAIRVRNGIKKDIELQNEYPTLQREDRINGVVVFKYDFKKNGYRDFLSESLVTIENANYSIIADEVKNKNDYGINEIIEVGDYLSKKEGNDTIVVTKQNSNNVYFFIRRDKLY